MALPTRRYAQRGDLRLRRIGLRLGQRAASDREFRGIGDYARGARSLPQ
jgi:hypothetical protein